MLTSKRLRKLGELGGAVIVVALSLTIGRVAGAAMFAGGQPAPLVAPDTSAPEFLMVRGDDGELAPLELASRAKPLVVFALSVDCPYCRKNLSNWREIVSGLRQLEKGPDVLVFSLSSVEKTRAYLRENELPVDAVFVDKNELSVLGLPGVPGTIAFGTGEAPMRRLVGVLNEEEIESLIAWAEATSSRQ